MNFQYKLTRSCTNPQAQEATRATPIRVPRCSPSITNVIWKFMGSFTTSLKLCVYPLQLDEGSYAYINVLGNTCILVILSAALNNIDQVLVKYPVIKSTILFITISA